MSQLSQTFSTTQSTSSIGTSNINPEVMEIFNNVQKLSTRIERRIHFRKLQILFKEIPIREFYASIKQCLTLLFSHSPSKHTFNVINFVALFCEKLQYSKSEKIHPFILKVFRFLIKILCDRKSKVSEENLQKISMFRMYKKEIETIMNAKSRYLSCLLFHKILKTLPRTASYNEDLYYKIRDTMLVRLRDVSGVVRATAANILHYFQNIDNPEDCIKKAFLYHLIDPNANVRQSILKNLARDYKIIPHVIDRLFDVKERVQYEAYEFLSFFSYKTFKIHQRHVILKNGLQHESEKIKTFVENKLVQAWLDSDDSIFTILSSLVLDADSKHIEKSTHVCELLLNVYFNSQPLQKSIEELVLDVNRTVPLDNITYERITYWRYLIAHISENDILHDTLPDLKLFCDYIREYMINLLEHSQENNSESLQQMILLQLFEILNYFDFTETYSSEYTKHTLTYIFTNEKISEEIANRMMDVYVKIVPVVSERITSVIAIVTNLSDSEVEIVELSDYKLNWRTNKLGEIRTQKLLVNAEIETAMKFKDWDQLYQLKSKLDDLTTKEDKYNAQLDSELMMSEEERYCQGLKVIASLLNSAKPIAVNSELQALYKHFIKEKIEYNSLNEKTILAIKCSIRLSLFDGNIAKTVIPMLFVQLFISRPMENENQQLILTCLVGIVDLLHLYGLRYFPESQENNVDAPDCELDTNNQFEKIDQQILSNELIALIIYYFKHDNYKFRKAAVKGLCRLLLANRIPSVSIVRDLMLFYFDPNSSKKFSKILHIIYISLQYGAEHVRGFQELLVHTFFLVLEQYEDKYDQMDTFNNIISVVLFLTDPQLGVQSKNCHNSIAIMMCERILQTSDDDLKFAYASNLEKLKIDVKNSAVIEKLSNLLREIKKKNHSKNVTKAIGQYWTNINSHDLLSAHISDEEFNEEEDESNDF